MRLGLKSKSVWRCHDRRRILRARVQRSVGREVSPARRGAPLDSGYRRTLFLVILDGAPPQAAPRLSSGRQLLASQGRNASGRGGRRQRHPPRRQGDARRRRPRHNRAQAERGGSRREPARSLHADEQPSRHGLPLPQRPGLDDDVRQRRVRRPDGLLTRRPHRQPARLLRRPHPPGGSGDGMGECAGRLARASSLPVHLPHHDRLWSDEVGVGAGPGRFLFRRGVGRARRLRHRYDRAGADTAAARRARLHALGHSGEPYAEPAGSEHPGRAGGECGGRQHVCCLRGSPP